MHVTPRPPRAWVLMCPPSVSRNFSDGERSASSSSLSSPSSVSSESSSSWESSSSSESNSKNCVHYSRNSFSAKFGSQNYNISHLFCKVWTGCNIVNMFNAIAHSMHDQAYLYGRKIWCTNSRMRVRNMHSPNVGKSHPRVGQSAKSFSVKNFVLKKKSSIYE